jgi:hypothetical protein
MFKDDILFYNTLYHIIGVKIGSERTLDGEVSPVYS